MTLETRQPALEIGRRVLSAEAKAITDCLERLDERFSEAVSLILSCQGRLVTLGVGKSGHVAAKSAATFASTGTPALFVHAGEAAHGDLGMITADDVVIAISHSGETPEIVGLLPFLRARGATLIALTDVPDTTLAVASDLTLLAHCTEEADPLGLAPTASTTVAMAYADALAIAVASARGFTAEQFHGLHPGGVLGERLRQRLSHEGPQEAQGG